MCVCVCVCVHLVVQINNKPFLYPWMYFGCTKNKTVFVHRTVSELKLQGAAEIVKHFKILVTCFSARVSRSAGI